MRPGWNGAVAADRREGGEMKDRLRRLLWTALAVLAAASAARAQTAPPPPTPVGPGPGGNVTPAGPPPVGLGAPLPAPALPPPSPVFVPAAPALPPPTGGVLLPEGCPTGDVLFFSVELGVLAPTVKNELMGSIVHPDGSVDSIQPPRADLSWTVSPRFDIGYLLPDQQGEFSLGYRFLVTDGTGDTVINGVDFATRSRLNVNLFDLDYATAPCRDVLPHLDSQLRVGARLGSFFYDSRIQNDALAVSASNNFLGAGPHFGADVERRIVLVPGLGLFARADGAVLIGQIKQNFSETFTAPDGATATAGASVRHTQTVEALTLEAGVSYTPQWMEYMRFRAGYQFERYWNLGQASGSNLELTTQGVFLRGQFDF
jgi:hypothetical protein